ncbi:hypothetical protein V8E36_000238 [Tilletia maclaganii]
MSFSWRTLFKKGSEHSGSSSNSSSNSSTGNSNEHKAGTLSGRKSKRSSLIGPSPATISAAGAANLGLNGGSTSTATTSNHLAGHGAGPSSLASASTTSTALNASSLFSDSAAAAGASASLSSAASSAAAGPAAAVSGGAYPNGHLNGHAAVNGDLHGASGKLVQRLRVWEELERPDMPLLGFENFGNTCYANSVLQALYHCQPFRESLLKHRDENPPKKAIIAPDPPPPQPHSSKTTSAAATAIATADPAAQGPIPYALQDLFAQMTEQSIATAQAVQAAQQAPPVGPAITAPNTGFSAKRAFSGLGMGGGGGGGNAAQPAASAAQGSSSTGGGFSMGASAGGASTSSAPGHSNTPGGGSSAGAGANAALTTGASGKDGASSTKHAVDQAAIKAFLAALRKENVMFDSTMHQDAHEMLNFVLNRVGEELVDGGGGVDGQGVDGAGVSGATSGSSPRKSPARNVGGGGQGKEQEGKTCVHRLFEGKLTNETRCMTCETVTSRDESFLDLSIDIEQNSSVTSCLRQFSASETLRSRNKFFCDTCSGLQEAEKRMKVKQLPNVLALHLKRFKYEETVQKYIKLAYRVVFPMQLRLFNTSDTTANPDRLYTLFAIVVHIGAGMHHGHYIAIVRVGSRWVSFDDDTVETLDEMDIARYFGDTPGVGSAYVLFYQADDLDREALGLGNGPSGAGAGVGAGAVNALSASPSTYAHVQPNLPFVNNNSVTLPPPALQQQQQQHGQRTRSMAESGKVDAPAPPPASISKGLWQRVR